MKKRVICLLLIFAMVIPMAITTASAAGAAEEPYTAKEIDSNYFYDQLNDRAKAIYNELLNKFSSEETKENYYEGKEFIDLIDVEYGADAADNKAGQSVISTADIDAYKKGNKEIFNDFCAAKDALDLDHSELWWIDSGYLTFRVTQDNKEGDADGKYHVLIGPGRGETYLLGGNSIEGVKEKDEAVNKKINDMVNAAVSELNSNPSIDEYSQQDRIAYLVGHIHDQITKGIHYRYEIECHEADNAKYIRTVYGIITHEGVCEAYARTLQVALTKLGIECVLIHGVQSKGTPEDHMWNAVNIPDDDGTDHWYVVDATWDDPLVANYNGTQDLSFNYGLDGRETNTYLLVGNSLVGEYWNPSGYVSTGNFEFTYPDIELNAYSGAVVYDGKNNGLEVKYTAGGSTEDSTAAGTFTITYNGQNAAEARKNGIYFMLKMYDYHPDGTADVMQDWYYTDAVENLAYGNPYIGDREYGFRLSTSTCEYVEIAVTTRKPDHFDEWSSNPYQSYLSKNPEAGFFHGDESEIVAQTGMLYNVNAGYEAPPYVKTQFPAPNGNCTAGVDYRFKVVYDDLLYHILPTDKNAQNGLATADAFEDNYEKALSQTVQVRYTTVQENLHAGDGSDIAHTVVGDLNFDKDRDGIVDMDADSFRWIYASDTEDGTEEGCPIHKHESVNCNVENGCPIVGVEFDFKASDLWIDDITNYNFTIEGVVGSRSSKYPNNFSITARVPGLCPACYRSQGIDWNLWGQPTLLDAPENLDLAAMAREGGTDQATIDKLNEEMNRKDLNGRLMLVVEDKSKGVGSREEYEKINDALPEEEKKAIESSNEVFSSVFEINFNRICPAVKLKPNAGQSLRVQVGYPAGITYEDLENYDLKAYHFTRCSNDGEEYWCDEFKEEYSKLTSSIERKELIASHKWGDHIVSTEQITLIPTPYGIVIMCEAFSPFEIVAVKKDGDTPAAVAAEATHNVIVVSGENGKVMIGNVEAVGANGNMTVKEGGSLTITVKPDQGYEVDTVSFGGEAVNGTDGKYTITDVNKSDVLNVTFIPKDVKDEEEKDYGTTVVAAVCQHKNSKKTKEAVAAKCTIAGCTEEITCEDCGAVIKTSTVIPATGHTNTETVSEAVKATCTTGGKTAQIKCNDCDTVISKQSDIQPLGHVFTNYVDTNEKTCQGTKAVANCDHAGCKVTDTKYQTWGAQAHNFVTKVNEQSKAATCTEDEVVTLKCQWCEETTTETKANTATGHTLGPNGVCIKCNTFLCASNKHIWEEIPAAAATCTQSGHEAGKVCTVCGFEEPGDIIDALGHDFPNHTKGTKCSRCDQRLLSDEHTPADMQDVAPTCDTHGTRGGKICSQCGDIVTQPEIIEALGHDWETESAVWHWSTEGGKVTASVTFTCYNDTTHKETFEAVVTETTTEIPATCTATGEGTFTAAVTVKDEQPITNASGTLTIPAKGHTWDTQNPISITDATCTNHATATYRCKNCDATEVVTLTESELAAHQLISATVTLIPATCTEPGKEAGICSVCGQEVEIDDAEDAPALGHSYGGYYIVIDATCTEDGLMRASCVRGDASVTRTISARGHNFVDGVCSRCGLEENPQVWVNPFADVPSENNWYTANVEFVVERKLMNGLDDSTFAPDLNASRKQITAILARLAGVEEASDTVKWAEAGLEWAAERGICDGTNPDMPINREMFITMLWRYQGMPRSSYDMSDFGDFATVSDFAREAMAWAVENHLLNGYEAEDGFILQPLKTASRAECAAFLQRFCETFDL